MNDEYRNTVWRYLSLVLFGGMITVNALANALPLNGKTTGELSAQYPNLFVPAGYTFSIWGIIYILLAVFTVYQLLPHRKDRELNTLLSRLRPLYVLSCLANGAWIFAWHYELIGLSVLIMLILLAALAVIYRHILQYKQTHSPDKKVLAGVAIPFSVYIGWISVATIANVTALLVHLQWQGFGLPDVFWFGLMVLAAAVLGILYLKQFRDYPFNAVLLWSLGGIMARRLNQDLPDTELLFIIPAAAILLILATASYCFFRDRRQDESRTPRQK